jgi:hypothetical protein
LPDTRLRAFQRHQQSRFHLRLRTIDLGVGEGFGGVADLIDHHAHQFRRVSFVRAGIKREQASVRIRHVEGMDRVAKAADFAHFLEQS